MQVQTAAEYYEISASVLVFVCVSKQIQIQMLGILTVEPRANIMCPWFAFMWIYFVIVYEPRNESFVLCMLS